MDLPLNILLSATILRSCVELLSVSWVVCRSATVLIDLVVLRIRAKLLFLVLSVSSNAVTSRVDPSARPRTTVNRRVTRTKNGVV